MNLKTLSALFLIFSLLAMLPPARAATGATDVLPLEIQVDLLINELSQKREENDAVGIIEVIAKIRALNAPFPNFLHWIEAKALADTGNYLDARDRLLAYLKLDGQEGRFYQDATQLLVEIAPKVDDMEKQLAAERRRRERELAETQEKARFLRTQDAQRYLHELGFPVKVDGEMDEATREAIAVFQVRRNLRVNGEITDELLDTLRTSVPTSHACDELAFYSRSAEQWRTISWQEMDSLRAVTECNDALRDYPDVLRFKVQYGRALAAGGRGQEALFETLDLFRRSEPAIQYLAAEIYLSGQLDENGNPDFFRAVYLIELSAAQGYARAKHKLAELYEFGNRALKKSMSRAFNTYLEAAEQGYPPAQLEVAEWYRTGRGASRNYAMAAKWYERAAGAELPEAYYQLGYLYERGQGVTKSKVIAKDWYQKASVKGHSAAKQRLSRMR